MDKLASTNIDEEQQASIESDIPYLEQSWNVLPFSATE
jgi:hypothetical protein